MQKGCLLSCWPPWLIYTCQHIPPRKYGCPRWDCKTQFQTVCCPCPSVVLRLLQNQDHCLFFPLQYSCWLSCRRIQGQIYRQIQECHCSWWRVQIILERLHHPLQVPPTWICQVFRHAFLCSCHQGTVCLIGMRWDCRMHQNVYYFDWYFPLGLWLTALWFWILGFYFQVESNN